MFPWHPLRMQPHPAAGRPAAPRRRFGRDSRGSVATIFAITLLPIMLLVGLAVDYAQAQRVRSRLNALADFAALAAARRDMINASAADAKAAALRLFRAQLAQDPGVVVSDLQAEVVDDGGTRRVVLTYRASVRTVLMTLGGIQSLTISGTASSATQRPVYVDFYLLLDNTPSMGLGATVRDIDRLAQLTANETWEGRCGFACHIEGSSNDRLSLARANGVQTRIDVVRQATQRLFDTAAAATILRDQFRAAIYTHGVSCRQVALREVSALTANLTAAKTAAEAIQLMSTPYRAGYPTDVRCTDNRAILNAVSNVIPASGDGLTSATPQKILFMVADGLTDTHRPQVCAQPLVENGRCLEPLDTAVCDSLKRRGVKIAVLYTTYLPLPGRIDYDYYIAPYQPTIGARMQQCASPGLYFEVSPSQGIAEAMIALFQKVVATVRLTS